MVGRIEGAGAVRMATETLVLYVIAALCAFIWGASIAINRMQLIQAGTEIAINATDTTIAVIALVVRIVLSFVAMVLLAGALFFTVRPFLDNSGNALSQAHILGMVIDWSAFMLVSALVQTFEELTALLRNPPDLSDDEIEEPVAEPTPPILMAAGAAGAGSPTVQAPKSPPSSGQAALPSITIVRDVPDHWIR